MKVVVAGYGPVGQAVVSALENHPGDIDIFVDDPQKGFNFEPHSNLTPVDAVVISVATPALPDGRCDTSNVAAVLDKYYALNSDTKFLIKSAVDPLWLSGIHETANSLLDRHFNLTNCPEFLGGSNMHRDTTAEFMGQKFAIYGGDACRFWDELFRPVLPELKDVRYTTLEQAAFSKYVENCFLATKVTFFNEMYEIFNNCGFEGFDGMVEAITLDPRIGWSHTQVPGPDGKFGYGGHCFPKDMAALRTIAADVGQGSDLLDVVVELNEKHRYS